MWLSFLVVQKRVYPHTLSGVSTEHREMDGWEISRYFKGYKLVCLRNALLVGLLWAWILARLWRSCLKCTYQLFVSFLDAWISLSLLDGIRAWIDNLFSFWPISLSRVLRRKILALWGRGGGRKFNFAFGALPIDMLNFLGGWVCFWWQRGNGQSWV